MTTLSKCIASAVFAAGVAVSLFAPKPAHAQDDLTRVIVDVADVVLRGGQPYYRYGTYRDQDRLVVVRDRYGRPVYYRVVDRPAYRPYVAYRPYEPTARRVKCNKHGNCTVSYYDPAYDRRGYDGHRRGHRHHGNHQGDQD